MKRMKNYGDTIRDLPARALLEHDEIPGAVADALAAWDSARADLKEARSTLAAAEKVAREASTRATRDDVDAEVRAVTQKESGAERAAGREAKSTGERLIAALKEHADDVDALGARMTLQAHAAEGDALVEADEARRAKVSTAGRHPSLVPSWSTVGGVGDSARHTSDLERADLLIDAHRLAEIAGSRCGLVEVAAWSTNTRHTILTSPRRAEHLVARGGHGMRSWALVDDENEEGTR